MSYVVVGELQALAGCAGELEARLLAHAQASRREAGCRAFEVCRVAEQEAGHLFLYEVYANARAYQDHRASAHYRRFLEYAPRLLSPGADGGLLKARRVLRRLE